MNQRDMTLLTVLALTTACPTDDPDEGADTGGQTEGGTAELTTMMLTTIDPTAAETSGDSTGRETGTDGGSGTDSSETTVASTAGGSSGGAQSSGEESTGGSTTGAMVDPADLPYGGFVWNYYFEDGIHLPLAVMETLEYPEGVEPSFQAAPLPDAPPEEAQWVLSNEPVEWDPDAPSATATGYSVGPQFFFEDATVSFQLEEDPASVGFYQADFEFAEYVADAWTVDFPGGDETPAQTFPDVLAAEPPQFEFVMEDGVVATINWTPYAGDDYTQIEIWTSLEGEGLDDIEPCSVVAPDTGTLDIPIECFYPEGGVDEGYTELWFTIERLHAADIAYNDHRIRLEFVAARQENFEYPLGQ